ncbi:hypothetical protein CARUB_v10028044mg [Capsella rubella]|uniref:Knottin scorpion toxin-like domain-containing protein n=1 Tax=Capsella rubella TaxID=81985 RepID=R0ETN5_9BRAS|nr:defensin-like protein 76 [Capsella rubella]EOA12422.1 hypothetical protein CARUB_v10028044mg [Capsella rubella]
MQSKKKLHIFTAITVMFLFAMAVQTKAIVIRDADCFHQSKCTKKCEKFCLRKGYTNGWYCSSFRTFIGCCCKKNKGLKTKVSSSKI